jgi:hypothetical protein
MWRSAAAVVAALALLAGCEPAGEGPPAGEGLGQGATLAISVAALLGDDAPTGIQSLRVQLFSGIVGESATASLYDTGCIGYQGETLRLFNQPPGEGYSLLIDLYSDGACAALAHRGLRGEITIEKAGNVDNPYVVPVATVGAFRRLPGVAGEHFPLGPWRTRAFHSAVALGDGRVGIVGGAESVNGDQVIGGDGWPVVFDSRTMLFTRVPNGPLGGQRIMAQATAALPDGRLVVAGGVQALRLQVRESAGRPALTFDVPEYICYTDACNTPNFVQRISLVDTKGGTSLDIQLATARVFATLDLVDFDIGPTLVLAGGVPGADRFDDYDAFACLYRSDGGIACDPVSHVAPRAGQASACFRSDGGGGCTALAFLGGALQDPAGSSPFVEFGRDDALILAADGRIEGGFAAASVADAPEGRKRLMARAAGAEGVVFVTGGVEGATLPAGEVVGGGSVILSASGAGSFVPFAGGEGVPSDAGHLLFHTVTGLGGGRVLVAGGLDADLRPTNRAFILRAAGGTFTVESAPSLTTPRFGHTATRIVGGPLDGAVLVTGGFRLDQGTGELKLVDTAEILLPAFAVGE